MLLANLMIAIAAYLLGSIPTGYLLVRIFRHQDIRSIGSGNIGATNVLRSGGKGLGLGHLLSRHAQRLCRRLARRVCSPSHSSLTAFQSNPIRNFEALAALCAVLGHMFPPWLRFRGGKGVATGFGVFLVAAPLAALAAITVFFLTILASPAMSRWAPSSAQPAFRSSPGFSFAETARPSSSPSQFIVACSSSPSITQNIRRLLAGTESRFGAKKHA